MRSLKIILMLLGALSVLMLGAVPAAAMTGEAAPPCHAATQAAAIPHPQAPIAPEDPDGAMAMACCVSHAVMPAPQPPARHLTDHPEAPAAPAPASLPVGLSPAPEPAPPRA